MLVSGTDDVERELWFIFARDIATGEKHRRVCCVTDNLFGLSITTSSHGEDSRGAVAGPEWLPASVLSRKTLPPIDPCQVLPEEMD